jgi:CBS domain-containing protein
VQVGEIMNTDVLAVGREDTLREAARQMSGQNVASAIVEAAPPESRSGIITERDVVDSVAARQDPESARVADNFTPEAVSVPPESSLHRAAEEMSTGGFRHLAVLDRENLVGVVSMRDIIDHWQRRGPLLGLDIPIRDAMSTDFPTLRADDTLREAARGISGSDVGAALVDLSRPRRPPVIVTGREVLQSVGADQDPDAEGVADHLAPRMTFSAPGWSLSQATEAMAKGGFQHIVVVDQSGTVGIISMLGLVKCIVGS